MQNADLRAEKRHCREQGVSRTLVFVLAAGMTLASAEEVGPRTGVSMPITLEKLYINNRRYLGNKYKLLSVIRKIVDENCERVHSFVDIFAGTGSVASAFGDKKLIVNDILYCNHICHIAWFSGERYSEKKIATLISGYNRAVVDDDNYMSKTFADTYFSKSDCRKIGYVREDIECQYSRGEINTRERALLITSLLYAMDKIANTVGHYDAYRKGVSAEPKLMMRMPVPPKCAYETNVCYCQDANKLVKMLGPVDVFFMDPPYNSRQYADAYHLLENVAEWKKPPVEGVAKKMDRSMIKSDYCTRKAEDAFADLVAHINARYIILTYNNMAEKGNDRSNAKLSDVAIMSALESRGEVKVFNVKHRAFTTGKSDRDDNFERIFLCICNEEKRYLASPLNYTGGKFKIMDQLLTNFPGRVDTFVDLFCGGCNVGINVSAKKTVFMDSNTQLIDLLRTMQVAGADKFLLQAKSVVKKFGLSDSEANGYRYYNCDSSFGLGSYNKDGFARLRKHYAQLPEKSFEKSVALYVLVVYGFNNQLRFNAKGEFNLPVGKRDLNAKMQQKAKSFIERICTRKCVFRRADFRDIELGALTGKDFVYADPPYLITTATYNENGGWTENDERDLLGILDKVDRRGIRFALSNVTECNGKTNQLLKAWIAQNEGKYRVIEIARDYSNANYQRKRNGDSHEVLVINY